jgi:hypothetical protein
MKGDRHGDRHRHIGITMDKQRWQGCSPDMENGRSGAQVGPTAHNIDDVAARAPLESFVGDLGWNVVDPADSHEAAQVCRRAPVASQEARVEGCQCGNLRPSRLADDHYALGVTAETGDITQRPCNSRRHFRGLAWKSGSRVQSVVGHDDHISLRQEALGNRRIQGFGATVPGSAIHVYDNRTVVGRRRAVDVKSNMAMGMISYVPGQCLAGRVEATGSPPGLKQPEAIGKLVTVAGCQAHTQCAEPSQPKCRSVHRKFSGTPQWRPSRGLY